MYGGAPGHISGENIYMPIAGMQLELMQIQRGFVGQVCPFPVTPGV